MTGSYFSRDASENGYFEKKRWFLKDGVLTVALYDKF